MKRSWFVALVVAVGLVLWLVLRGASDAHGVSAPRPASPVPAGPAEGTTAAPPSGAPLASFPREPLGQPIEPGVLVGATHQLAQAFMPQLDGCIGPVRARRVPVNVLVRFDRAANGHLVARDLAIHDPIAPAVRICLDQLKGRELALPPGGATPPVLTQPITLFLPSPGAPP